MAHVSMSGIDSREEVVKLCKKIMGNAAFITKEDKEVLEFLGKKGDFPNKKVVLIKK